MKSWGQLVNKYMADKMVRLTAQLAKQSAESATLECEMKKRLVGLGYEL